MGQPLLMGMVKISFRFHEIYIMQIQKREGFTEYRSLMLKNIREWGIMETIDWQSCQKKRMMTLRYF